MLAHLAHPVGSPCPTLALPISAVPAGGLDQLRAALPGLRAALCALGHPDVLKLALIGLSPHPSFDLDYRFIQCLPGPPERYDLQGSCGRSAVAAVMTAIERHWLPRLAPGGRVRVRCLNTDRAIVCEFERRDDDGAAWLTVHFVTRVPLDRLLPSGAPVDVLEVDGVPHPVTLATAGNPYVFADATGMALFADCPRLLTHARALQRAAQERFGFAVGGAFPKVALLAPAGPGRLAVRALAVPSWHPAIALTGAVCLAAAGALPQTLPHQLARTACAAPNSLTIQTASAVTAVRAVLAHTASGEQLDWASVPGARVDAPLPITLPGADGRWVAA